MHVDCESCIFRDWTASDKASLVQFADNRNIWRNLAHHFPHPYTEANADSWCALLAKMTPPSHWALEVDGQAVCDIGVILIGLRA